MPTWQGQTKTMLVVFRPFISVADTRHWCSFQLVRALFQSFKLEEIINILFSLFLWLSSKSWSQNRNFINCPRTRMFLFSAHKHFRKWILSCFYWGQKSDDCNILIFLSSVLWMLYIIRSELWYIIATCTSFPQKVRFNQNLIMI